MIGLEAQRIVYPRAYALGPAARHRLLGCSYQLSVNGGREPFLCAHTLMLHHCQERSSSSRTRGARLNRSRIVRADVLASALTRTYALAAATGPPAFTSLATRALLQAAEE